ncbi:MAG: spermine synthase, partial [Thermoleophilia bacterium]|nr:spermine synthase [Thermoleophilia bacterium]
MEDEPAIERPVVLPLGGTAHRTADRPAGPWLLLVVPVAGAALMAYEIVGSRLLAPFFGNSTFVWGSLISVFLGALALGYAIGGRLADRRPTAGALATILACSSLLVGATVLFAEPLQRAIIDVDLGLRTNPLVASVALFGPASVLMGMVSPYAVRLRAGDLASLGRTAGSLYGLSTAGSIAGTIAASFWLVQSFGSEATVLAVGVALAACALLTAFAGRASGLVCSGASVAMVVLLVLVGAGAGTAEDGGSFHSVGSGYSPVFRAGGYRPDFTPTRDGKLRAKADSSYHRIRVVDYGAGEIGERPARVMHFDNSLQAAAPLDGGKPDVTGPPLFGYLRGFDLVPAIEPDADRVLLVGLGSGAAAMRLHELRPKLRIDVVELDPKVVELARRWFGYRDSETGNDRIVTHVGDGRSWLAARDDDERYDAIVLDTYFADSIPFHLTTREFLQLVRRHLEPGGVAAANLIGAVEGPRSELLRSMRRTWADVFDDVVLYPVPNADGALDLRAFSNIELFAARTRGVLPSRGGEGPLFEAAHLSGTGAA